MTMNPKANLSVFMRMRTKQILKSSQRFVPGNNAMEIGHVFYGLAALQDDVNKGTDTWLY